MRECTLLGLKEPLYVLSTLGMLLLVPEVLCARQRHKRTYIRITHSAQSRPPPMPGQYAKKAHSPTYVNVKRAYIMARTVLASRIANVWASPGWQIEGWVTRILLGGWLVGRGTSTFSYPYSCDHSCVVLVYSKTHGCPGPQRGSCRPPDWRAAPALWPHWQQQRVSSPSASSSPSLI